MKGTGLARAQKYLNEGRTNEQVAKMVGVTEGTIRYALRKGRLKRRDVAVESSGQSEQLSRPRERSDEDVMASGGVAVKRHFDQALARGHKIVEAEPEFQPAEAVRKAGVLLALPALVDQGLFEVGQKVYGPLRNSYFGLNSVLLTFAVMALLRLKTTDQLPKNSPGEFGLVLGLDRAPEKKTARRKLAEMGRRGLAGEFAAGLAQRLAEQEPEALGYLYVDGHVRVYNGRKHKLPKTHVQRRRLCMPATTDYWVNDANVQPLLFITAEANDGLLSMLDNKILPEVRSLAGPDRRVTLIFDREGWSPKRFERWAEQGFDVLTYRKGKYDPWPEQCFFDVDSQVAGRKVTYRLGERSIRLSKTFWMREVRRLCDDGHQTSVMTTRQDVSIEHVARRMFSRWQQENFFRYMRHDFALDHMPALAVEPANGERMVPNPARKAKKKELNKLRAQLTKAHKEYGRLAIENPEGKRPTMRGFKIANGELGKQIRELTARCQRLDAEHKALPERIPVRQLLDDKENVRLETERKVLTDAIKMVAYRAETQLANLVGPLLPYR